MLQTLLREQGRKTLESWPTAECSVAKDARDFATHVDLEVESALIDAITRRCPEHGIQGEESPAIHPHAAHQWLIDPIDGTKYFAGRSSLFSISVALLTQGRPVLGLVHAPASGQMFVAVDGCGAWLDGQLLSSRRGRPLGEAIVNVDMPGSDALEPDQRAWMESRWLRLSRHAYRVRSLGAGALAACWQASGAFDAYVDLTGLGNAQDLAAGRVILAESGHRVGFAEGPGALPRLMAAPDQLYLDLAALLHAKD